MKHADIDARAKALLAPVAPLIEYSMEQLPTAPPLRIRVGECEGISELEGVNLTLSSGLEGPEVHHPDEPETSLPPLDRWRRAAGCVLEAVATLSFSKHVRRNPESDWRWRGAAIFVADTVAPDLNLAQHDIALAINTGNLAANPRGGVAVLHAWRAQGHDPMQRVQYLVGGGVISATEWLTLGRWILDPEGAGAKLPVHCLRPAAVVLPHHLEAWSWRPLRIDAHPRGGQIHMDGEGAVEDQWVVAGAPVTMLAAATNGGCDLSAYPGGPVGTWEVASAQGFGQVMGARGITFSFKASGALEIILADAFVGPLAAVTVAGEVGTSGVVWGRWKVAGANQMGFEGIASQSLTMHGRKTDRFMVPAKGFGIGEWLKALEDGVWHWDEGANRLVMRGMMMGGAIEVRLKK